MHKNFTRLGLIGLCLTHTLLQSPVFSQTITASPQNVIRPAAPNTVTVFLDRISGGWGDASNGNYVWSVSPSNGVVIGPYSQTSPAADVTVTFTAAASGTYTFQLTRGTISASIQVTVGSIAACSSTGNAVSAFGVLNGNYVSGPGNIFTPVVQTAALGLAVNGYFYYMPRDYTGNHGNVTIYAAKPDGSSSTAIASIDLNGSSDNDLGFVRMAVDPIGNGWLLSGDNSTLYLAKFAANGLNPTTVTVVDPSVSLVNGNVSSFFNGDICFSGNGNIYAMANTTNGPTQIFIGTPNGVNTILTKKWDLVNENGSQFSGSVNGIAFDALGSLYISTSTGLYYINQNTVNTAQGTVQCSLVRAVSGLTDLASNLYPLLSALPVRLTTFTGTYRNQKTTLNWSTEAESNFSHFEIQRSQNGIDYSPIATKPSTANGLGKQDYSFVDDLNSVNGNSFIYRLKMVDVDGQLKYSPVIVIHREMLSAGLTLLPNPVSGGMASVRMNVPANGSYKMTITDINGRTVLQQQLKLIAGNNSIAVNGMERLLNGNYLLTVAGDAPIQTIKFIVAR